MDKEKKIYVFKLYGAMITLLGAGLLAEHIYVWGFDPLDILGHEWFGILLIAIGSVLGYLGLRTWRDSVGIPN